MLRSALTEQLTGGCAKPVEKTFAPLELLQKPAFPCLRYAEGEVIGAVPVVDDSSELPEVDIPDIGSVQLAGTSAPLGSIPKDKVRCFYCVRVFSRRLQCCGSRCGC